MFRLSRFAVLGALLVLAGCARTFEADISRFHRLQQVEAESFKIVAMDPKKSGSLEFEQYAALVRQQLKDEGYRPVEEDPAILVEMDYHVSEGREKIRSTPGYYGHHPHLHGFHHGHFGGFHGFHHGFGHHGFYGGGPRVYSETVHTVQLTVDMVRPNGEVVFEGRARSLVGDPNLPAVMPYLTQALFVDFPGESGRTRTVELELPKRADVGY